MRPYLIYLCESLLLVSFGCVLTAQGIPSNSVTVTSTAKISSPAATVVPRSTVTVTPSVTLQPQPSSTPTISSSPTPIPSLEPQAAEEAIRQLLKEDFPCQSPCFWGVIPDQTTLEEAQNIYIHLNMTLKLTYQEGDKQYYEARPRYGINEAIDDGLGLVANHIIQGGYVRSLRVGISNSKRSFAPEEWMAFSPRTLLKKYGPPSAVDFFLDYPHEPGLPEDAAWYDMILYFSDAHLIAYYDRGTTKSANLIRACPLEDFSGVSLWLGKNPANPPYRGVLLEKATTMTTDEFYDLLLRGSDQACFDLIPEAFETTP